MPFSFIAAMIFAVMVPIAAGGWFLASRSVRREASQDAARGGSRGYRDSAWDAGTVRSGFRFACVALIVLSGLMLLISSTTFVSTKNVGIVTSFGKPVGEPLPNGIHFVEPWNKVTEMDGAIQTDSHAGDAQGDTTPCTTVRIANQSTACVDNSIRWRIRLTAADELFRDYKDFDRVRDSLVTRDLYAALNSVFAGYDPLGTIASNGVSSAPSLDSLAAQVTSLLQRQIGDQIEVLNVIIPLAHYDASTQDKINQFQAELANTRIAKQRQQTAENEAAANAKLAASVSRDPNVLVSKCLDLLFAIQKAGQQIPAGFSCWPGGQAAAVIAQNK